jgi:hypothetical protein
MRFVTGAYYSSEFLYGASSVVYIVGITRLNLNMQGDTRYGMRLPLFASQFDIPGAVDLRNMLSNFKGHRRRQYEWSDNIGHLLTRGRRCSCMW